MRTRDTTIRKHILPRLGAVPIGEIKTADIQVWFDELCEQGYARASIGALHQARQWMEKNTPDVAEFVADEKTRKPL